MPATISMEPEGRVLGGTIIDVVESVGPAGRSSSVGVNSIETVRDDVEKDDRLSLAAFGVLDLGHDMLRLTRMGFNKNGISVPLVGMAEAEQRSATAPAAATGEEKR